jgi:tetratricopeptide (TPR) repeat protein
LSANPNDPDALNNAVAGLIQAQKYPEAIQLMEKARSQGALKSEKDYVNLAKLHLMQAQSAGDDTADTTAAVQVLQDGMSKGIVQQSSDNYKLMGDAHVISGETDQALQMYRKAVPNAKDGEAAVAAGSILLNENEFGEAKSLLQQGIDKGVKHKGNAYLMLANANRGLKDKAAAIAAVKMAAQDPETTDKANAWLKKSGADH